MLIALLREKEEGWRTATFASEKEGVGRCGGNGERDLGERRHTGKG